MLDGLIIDSFAGGGGACIGIKMRSVVDDFIKAGDGVFGGFSSSFQGRDSKGADMSYLGIAVVFGEIEVEIDRLLDGVMGQQAEAADVGSVGHRLGKFEQGYIISCYFCHLRPGSWVKFNNIINKIGSDLRQKMNFHPQGGGYCFHFGEPGHIPDILLFASDFFIALVLVAGCQEVGQAQADDTEDGGQQGLPVFHGVASGMQHGNRRPDRYTTAREGDEQILNELLFGVCFRIHARMMGESHMRRNPMVTY